MFVDYLTVMMVAVVAGAAITIVYGLMFLDAPLADHLDRWPVPAALALDIGLLVACVIWCLLWHRFAHYLFRPAG
jgi:hypothetical protein